MKKVMIVEDDSQTRTFFRQSVLAQEPCELKVCGNGDEAASLLDAEPFYLMITDLDHPGLSGVELVIRARQNVRHGQLRILVVSESLRLPSACGADVYMGKPFERKLFAHVLSGLLGHRFGAEVETPEAVQVRLADISTYTQANRRICPERSAWARLVRMMPNAPEEDAAWPPLPPPIDLLILLAAIDGDARRQLQRLLRHAATEGVLKHVDRFLRGLSESEWRHEG